MWSNLARRRPLAQLTANRGFAVGLAVRGTPRRAYRADLSWNVWIDNLTAGPVVD